MIRIENIGKNGTGMVVGLKIIKSTTARKTGSVSKINFTFDLCSGEAKKRTSLTVTGKQKMPMQTTIVPSTCTPKQ